MKPTKFQAAEQLPSRQQSYRPYQSNEGCINSYNQNNR
jgi:hypothetical protein